jgi:hypothetical protein
MLFITLGNIAIRSIRVEQKFATDQEVKEQRARDKVFTSINCYIAIHGYTTYIYHFYEST